MNPASSLNRRAVLLVLLALGSGPALAAAPPTVDGLVEVRSRRVDAAFLLPDADFRQYTKIMIEPAEVAFRANWLRSVNRSRGSSRRVNEQDAQRIAEAARTGFGDIFERAFRDAGYEIATAPGAERPRRPRRSRRSPRPRRAVGSDAARDRVVRVVLGRAGA